MALWWSLLVSSGSTYTGLERSDGIVAGGSSTSTVIERLTYEDDSISAYSVALDTGAEWGAAASSGSAVYLSGGLSGTRFIQKALLASDSVTTLSATQATERYGASGVQASDEGFFAGGYDGTNYSTELDGIRFSTETSTNTSNSLSVVKGYSAAIGNNTYALVAGGTLAGGAGTDVIEQFTHGTSIVDTTSATLSQARAGLSASTDETNAFFVGGDTYTIIDKVGIATLTSSVSSGTLSIVRHASTGLSADADGYYLGGDTNQDVIDKQNFTSETSAAITDVLATPRGRMAGGSQNVITNPHSGYLAGGSSLGVSYSDDIEKIQFDIDTVYDISTVLSQIRDTLGACASSTKCYWGGGYDFASSPRYRDNIDGLITSTDAAFTVIDKLDSEREFVSACAASSKGYWGGGATSGADHDDIQSIEFSSDTSSTTSAILEELISKTGACASADQGYWGGGSRGGDNYENQVSGINFVNDSTFNPAVTLTLGRQWLAACASDTHGYWGGGTIFATGAVGDIDGVKFSDDSAFNPSTALATFRYAISACASATHGYWFGGSPTGGGSFLDDIEGIQFSDDSVFNPSAVLAVPRHDAAACAT